MLQTETGKKKCKSKICRNLGHIKEFCLYYQSIKGFLFGDNMTRFGIEKITLAAVCRMDYRNKNGCR